MKMMTIDERPKSRKIACISFAKRCDERFFNILADHLEPTITPQIAADALNISPDAIKQAIVEGNCPFGFYHRTSVKGKRYFKIITPKFIRWYLNITGRIIQDDEI